MTYHFRNEIVKSLFIIQTVYKVYNLFPTCSKFQIASNEETLTIVNKLSIALAEGLKEYFGKFGDIAEVMVMKDPTTKRSRGFGFVTFSDPNSVDKVLAHGLHDLDGKKVRQN